MSKFQPLAIEKLGNRVVSKSLKMMSLTAFNDAQLDELIDDFHSWHNVGLGLGVEAIAYQGLTPSLH